MSSNLFWFYNLAIFAIPHKHVCVFQRIICVSFAANLATKAHTDELGNLSPLGCSWNHSFLHDHRRQLEQGQPSVLHFRCPVLLQSRLYGAHELRSYQLKRRISHLKIDKSRKIISPHLVCLVQKVLPKIYVSMVIGTPVTKVPSKSLPRQIPAFLLHTRTTLDVF